MSMVSITVEIVRAQPLIQRLKINGMLSFGPQGIDLPMERLNVLIGPNGSGKSNFIEALALLQAAPRDLSAPVKRMGGFSEWLWQGDGATGMASVEAVVSYPSGTSPLRHTLLMAQQGERFEVRYESIGVEPTDRNQYRSYYVSTDDKVEISGLVAGPGSRRTMRTLDRNAVHRDASILSQREGSGLVSGTRVAPATISQISTISKLGIRTRCRPAPAPRADQPSTFLTERGENLALLLSKLRGNSRQEFIKSMQQIYDGIEGFYVQVGEGRGELFVEESGGGVRYIPASRLSDGTLRYMMLAAILLDPQPPPLLVIEEPELGLHPDVVLGIGEMLIQASERTQLVVTTHSRVLINALEDHASSVVVCEKRNGQSVMKRLDPERLEEWLEQYSLGYLWSIGELGGNRW